MICSCGQNAGKTIWEQTRAYRLVLREKANVKSKDFKTQEKREKKRKKEKERKKVKK